MKTVFISVSVIVAVVIGVGVPYIKSNTVPKVLYKTEPLTRGDIVVNVTTTGIVAPSQLVQIGSQVSGTVNEVLKTPNDIVHKGDVLARLDTQILLAEKRTTEVHFIQTKAALEALGAERKGLDLRRSRLNFDRKRKQLGCVRSETELVLARKNYDRYVDLVRADAQPKAELELRVLDRTNAETALELARVEQDSLDVEARQIEVDELQLRSREKQAEAEISQAEEAVKRADTNLNYATIASPIDGIVLERSIEPGQTITASFQTPILFKIASNLRKVRIDAYIDEADVSRIKSGQEVMFEASGYRDFKFKGLVEKVQLQSVTQNNLVTYPVLIAALNPMDDEHPFGKLMPGMTVTIKINVATRKDVLCLPVAATRFFPESFIPIEQKSDVDENSGVSGTVYTLDSSGSLRQHLVTTGESSPDRLELLAGDVKEGSAIVIGPTE